MSYFLQKKKGEGNKGKKKFLGSYFIILFPFSSFALSISPNHWQHFASRGQKG